jgi:hypothetical protein
MSKIAKILVMAALGCAVVVSGAVSAQPYGARGVRGIAAQGSGQRVAGFGRRIGYGRSLGMRRPGLGIGLAVAGLAAAGAASYPYGYGYGAGYPGYGYGNPYGGPYAQPGYYVQGYYPQAYVQDPDAGPAAMGVGHYCATPVKTCQLYEASYVGIGCSCRVAGGRSRGTVAP